MLHVTCVSGNKSSEAGKINTAAFTITVYIVETLKEGRGLCECQWSQVVTKIIKSVLSAGRHWKGFERVE
jgi:hypothetical protein